MINEILIQKIQSGENVTSEQIIALEGEARLNELKAEANRRAELDQLETERAAKRELVIERMLSTDRAAEAARRKLETINRERAEAMLRFDTAEAEQTRIWRSCYLNFINDFSAIEPAARQLSGGYPANASELQQQVENFKNELKQRGARLSAVLYNVLGVGRSVLEVTNLPPLENEPPPANVALLSTWEPRTGNDDQPPFPPAQQKAA